MKRLLIFAIPVLMLFSCKKEERMPSPVTPPMTAAEKSASVFKYIKSLGYRDKDINDIGDKYIVDGDIAFDKSNPPTSGAPSNKPKTEQYSTSNLVGYDKQPNIVVRINPDMYGYWDEIHAAADMWNSIPNLRLHFTVVTDPNSTQDILISLEPQNFSFCGIANPPVNGKPGAKIFIVQGNLYNSTFAHKVRVVAHELGHAVGLRHSNWQERGENKTIIGPGDGEYTNAYQDAMHILGTPVSDDPNSIMHLDYCSTGPETLSSYDIISMQFLYPANPPMAGTVPVFRYYSRNTAQDHFYTTNFNEVGNGSNTGPIFEGIGFFAYPYQEVGTVPVYRYLNASSGDHYYTTNYSELGGGSQGYAYEGIRFYAYPSQQNGSVPIYRYYNGPLGDHFYTKNTNEAASGYTTEGIKFYAY